MDMNLDMLSWVVDERFATRLTLALLHFLWQGCCAGLLVYFFGLLLKNASARSRYAVNVAAMLVMAACLPVTFWLVGDQEAIADPIAAISPTDSALGAPPTDEVEMPAEVTTPIVASGDTIIAMAPPEAAPDRAPVEARPSDPASATVATFSIRSISSALPLFSRWIALIYFAGVAFILGRLFMGIWGGHRLRRMAIAIGDRNLIASYLRLAQRVGLRAAPSIAWCEQISIPVVVGIVRPMILLPMSLATALAPDQLQALLLHELSHVRRFDPIINLLQRIVEAGLFFHPVVWFVSRRISLERELAADDMVLAAGWARPAYADALVRVAEIAAGLSGPKLLRQAAILGATGKNPSDFKQRVLRLLGESQPPKLDLIRGGLGAIVLLLVMGGVVVWSQTTGPKAADDSHDSTRSATESTSETTSTHDPGHEDVQTPGAGANSTESSTAQSGKPSDADIERRVLEILRTPFDPDPKRGSWQRGAYEAQVLTNLSMSPRQDLVVKTVLKAVNGIEKISIFERRLAMIYLGGAAPEQIVPLLIKELQTDEVDSENRLRLHHDISVLEGIGEEAKDAAPILTKLLDSTDGEIGNAALFALVKVAPSSSDAMNAIASHFGEPDAEVWSRAVYEVGRYGELAKPLGPTFVKLLDAKSMEARDYAAWALVKSGYDEARGFDFLLRHVTEGDSARRAHAATFLAALGSQAQSVLPKLRALSSDPDPLVGKEIQTAIERIEKDGRILTHAEEAVKTKAGRQAAAEAIKRLRGEEDDADRAAEADKEPYDAYMKIMDFAPMNECKAAIKRLDDAGITKLASQSRERLAKRWKSISEQPVESFLREVPKKDPSEEIERGGGDRIGVQTELDGVWSNGKGTADSWKDWIARKQQDYRSGRLQLLFEAAQGYRKIDDAASAKRALIAGLTGYEIYDADLKTLIEKYWPISTDDPAKSLGSGPHAWTLANFLTELSAAQQSLGEIDQAIVTHSRLMLVHFMLSWKAPSAGPTQCARELWALVRKKQESMPPLFWFNVVDEKNPTKRFDLSTAGQKGGLLTYHHQNLTAAPLLDFAELKITAKTRGRKGILDVHRINREGKQETIGVLSPSAEGEVEQTLTKTIQIPAGTGLVQFLVAGDDFQVGEVVVDATFTKRSEGEVKESQQNRNDRSPQGARILRKPAVLLPDHWILSAVAFDREDQEIITVSNQSFATVRRWDVVNKKLISEIKLQGEVHGQRFREGTFVFSGDRTKVIAATDTYVGIWDTSSGALLKKIPYPTKFSIYDCVIDKLDCTSDLSVIAGNWSMPGRLTLSYDAHVMIWNGESGELLQTVIDKGATDLKSIDLSADGKLLATTHGGGASVWDTSTGRELVHVPNDNTGRKHPDPEVTNPAPSNVWSVQLSPNGEQLAFGDMLGVKLVDARSGKLLKQLEGPHRYGLGTLVFSPDGQWLARLGTEDTVEGGKTRDIVPIWSTKTGKRTFDLYTEANDAAFSADGKRVAIGFSDMQQALAIWPLDEGAADVEKPEGPGPGSRVDRVEENGHYRGKVAAEYALRFKPIWNKATHGLEYGIALTKPRDTYRIGERVPLVVFFRNVSDKPVKFDTQPDLFGNPPKVTHAKGFEIKLENVPLLGHIPHYHETLEPGEALGPLYLSFGLGENPRPGRQHWHPLLKAPGVGKYSLTHSITVNFAGLGEGDAKTSAEISSEKIEFEIVEGVGGGSKGLGSNPTSPTDAEKPADDTIELTGTVTNEKGEPVSKAFVVFPFGSDLQTQKRLSVKGETDESGNFAIVMKRSNVPEGARLQRHATIWAWAKGYSITGATATNPLVVRPADAPQLMKPVKLQLPPSSRSQFVLKTETGEPLIGARAVIKHVLVPLGYDYLPPELLEICESDAEGRIAFDFISRDRIGSLHVVSKSHGTQSFQMTAKPDVETLVVRPCGSLRGKLAGGPPEKMRNVRFVFTTSSESGSAAEGFVEIRTGDDGSFEIPAIAAGRLRIQPGLDPKQPWKIVGDDYLDAVSPGGDHELNLYVEEGIPVTGRLVVKGSGEPVANAELSIVSGKFYNRDSCTTNERGEFQTLVVRGEKVGIQVVDLTEHPELTYPDHEQIKATAIPRGVPTFRLPDIEIPKGKTWTGKLVDEGNRPVVDRNIQALFGNNVSYSYQRTTGEGEFKIVLREGEIPERWYATGIGKNRSEETRAEMVTESPLVLRIKQSAEK